MPESTEQNSPVQRPFTTFNFRIAIAVDEVSGKVCGGAFSECDGLEMSMEVKTFREGGRNTGPLHLTGPVGYAQLTLKRGMTSSLDLWRWFERVSTSGYRGVRTTAEITMLAADAATEQVTFVLTGCLPVKIKAPALNAKDGMLAIEEMQIAYESLSLRAPQGAGAEATPA